MKYTNKKVFITGGSEGIGKAIAMLFAKKGASVFIFSRSKVKIDAALKEIKQELTGQATTGGYVLDVADAAKVKATINRVVKSQGVPDYFINVAGFSITDYFSKISIAEHHQMMDVNYFGIVHTAAAIIPHFQKNGGGRIVNTASMSSFLPMFGYSGYTATKFAILGLTEVLQTEYKNDNIKFSVLAPSDTETPGFEEENKRKPAETVEISKAGKCYKADEIAKLFERGFRRKKFF